MFITLTFFHPPTGDITTLSTSPTALLSSLRSHVQTAFLIPPGSQTFFHDDKPLGADNTLQENGVTDGDLISVHGDRDTNAVATPSTSTAPVPASSAPGRSGATTSGGQQPGRSNRPSAQEAIDMIRVDPSVMNPLRAASQSLHDRVVANDLSVLPEIMQWLSGHRPGGRAEPVDPLSEDGQREIEKQIRKENVARNLEAAIEYNPESFGRVVMLFVDCKVNGVNIKAFVDSGAQATIISKDCAKRCNILHLLDIAFAGVAHGVGTAKIFGRIHLTLLTLDKEVFEVSFTVMDSIGGGYDILLGLDMLRKHQAKIDLEDNCLKIGASKVPFLAEKDIPAVMRGDGTGAQPGPSEGNAQGATAGAGSAPEANLTSTGGPPPGPSAAAADAPPAAIRQLVDLGFQEREVREALAACGNNVEQAATLLTSRKYGM